MCGCAQSAICWQPLQRLGAWWHARQRQHASYAPARAGACQGKAHAPQHSPGSPRPGQTMNLAPAAADCAPGQAVDCQGGLRALERPQEACRQAAAAAPAGAHQRHGRRPVPRLQVQAPATAMHCPGHQQDGSSAAPAGIHQQDVANEHGQAAPAAGPKCQHIKMLSTGQQVADMQSMCRPRERTHRPQTRKRRDVADDSMDKLRQLRANLSRARDMLDTLARREQRKAHLLVRFARCALAVLSWAKAHATGRLCASLAGWCGLRALLKRAPRHERPGWPSSRPGVCQTTTCCRVRFRGARREAPVAACSAAEPGCAR